MSRALPRITSHFVQSVVAVGGGGGPGAGADGGDAACSVGDSVVKAPVSLQALLLSEPVALTFQ
jgi:hypothetical protein